MQTVFAQSNASLISGTVAANGKATEAATVSLLRAKDSSLVKISVTDKEGHFAFEKAADGNYLIHIEAINFQTYYSFVFTVSQQQPYT